VTAGDEMASYDDNNIFAKILRGEIPCNKCDEDDLTLSFYDIAPQAPVHVLVIPKGRYVDYANFVAHASVEEIAGFSAAIHRVAEKTGISETGYRIISNIGNDGHQDVPHLHMHVLGGGAMGPMLAKRP
jgi:diadenosine tetraphosphate (Ap4A) HIT family hydrolase